MSVGVQREARGVMTEHRGHGFYIHAVLQRHGGEGVTQVMEAYPWQSRPFQHPLEHVQHAVRGHGASGGRWEYPFAVTRFSSLLHQNVYRVCRQRQGAVGVFCFQRHLNDLAVDAPDLPLNPKVSFFQINVRPF